MYGAVGIGCAVGDEGKAKVIDFLTPYVDAVARYAGGANAGHTVVVGDETYKFHLVPSGVVNPGVLAVCGGGMVIDPIQMAEEVEELDEKGISLNLAIAANAHVVLDYHKVIDVKKFQHLGTTKRGIGPAYSHKAARTGLRIGDLVNGDLNRAINRVIKTHMTELVECHPDFYGRNELSFEQAIYYSESATDIRMYGDFLFEHLSKAADRLREYVRDDISELLLQQGSVLFEGAQGAKLDLDNGSYPFVTSSNVGVAGLLSGMGIGHKNLDCVIGILKAYDTRVGTGPFPTWQNNEIGARILENGDEYGATTGRPRKCGWLDAASVKKAIVQNTPDFMAMNKIDILDGFEEVKFMVDTNAHGEPIYTTCEGWDRPTAGITSYEQLPPKAHEFISEVEHFLEVPMGLIGTGADRESIIVTDEFKEDALYGMEQQRLR